VRIILGGLARKCGKTTLVCRILALSPEKNWTAVKISHHASDPGAPFTLSEEQQPGNEGDTRRYLQAGAARAFWLRGDLNSALPQLLTLLAHSENWIVESTTAIPTVEHDYALLVVDPANTDDDKLRALLRAPQPER
jgi:hypothetical protein